MNDRRKKKCWVSVRKSSEVQLFIQVKFGNFIRDGKQ